MQYGSPSFRAFVFAVAIHMVIVALIIVSQYDLFKNEQHYKEPKIAISLVNPYIQHSSIEPPSPVMDRVIKPIENQSKKSPILEDKTTIVEENTASEITTPIVPIGRVAGLIKRHYGDIFEDLSPEEKAYIIENIITIHRIDRRVGNALLAEKAPNLFKDGDSNFVEMTLYPDGTISDISIIDEQSHKALDELTMETVEKSYSSYPRPNQKTLIRLHTRIQKVK